MSKAATTYTVGEIFHDEIGKITVLAVYKNYAMCRRPRCFPFILHDKKLIKRKRK